MTTPIFLDADAVARLTPMARCIDDMAEAMAAVSVGGVLVPPRLIAPLASATGFMAVMPASSVAPDMLAVKVVTLKPGNPVQGRPAIQGVVVLFDGETGAPVAVLDGAEITAQRTAAASGLATRLLARPDVRSHGVFGTGVQASRHIDAITAARPSVREVLIWGRSSATAATLAEAESRRTGLRVRATADAAEAAACDVISTVTAASEPVLFGANIQPGAHINVVGSHQPKAREIDTAGVVRARVYVDQRAAAMAEAGDLLMPMAEGVFAEDGIIGELGQVVLGLAPGRGSAEEITLFKSVGIAAQDLYAAGATFRRWNEETGPAGR